MAQRKNETGSFGLLVGVQHYLKNYGRSSFKYLLAYSTYNYESGDEQFYNLQFWYTVDFIRKQEIVVYGSLNILGLGYFVPNDWLSDNNSHFTVLPRFSPGLEMELRPVPRFSIFAEINNLLEVKRIPTSFGIGFKYDIGHHSW